MNDRPGCVRAVAGSCVEPCSGVRIYENCPHIGDIDLTKIVLPVVLRRFALGVDLRPELAARVFQGRNGWRVTLPAGFSFWREPRTHVFYLRFNGMKAHRLKIVPCSGAIPLVIDEGHEVNLSRPRTWMRCPRPCELMGPLLPLTQQFVTRAGGKAFYVGARGRCFYLFLCFCFSAPVWLGAEPQRPSGGHWKCPSVALWGSTLHWYCFAGRCWCFVVTRVKFLQNYVDYPLYVKCEWQFNCVTNDSG